MPNYEASPLGKRTKKQSNGWTDPILLTDENVADIKGYEPVPRARESPAHDGHPLS